MIALISVVLSYPTHDTFIPRYQQGIGSRTPWIPKSTDAQVPYIKWQSTVGLPYPGDSLLNFNPQLVESADAELWIERADCTLLQQP